MITQSQILPFFQAEARSKSAGEFAPMYRDFVAALIGDQMYTAGTPKQTALATLNDSELIRSAFLVQIQGFRPFECSAAFTMLGEAFAPTDLQTLIWSIEALHHAFAGEALTEDIVEVLGAPPKVAVAVLISGEQNMRRPVMLLDRKITPDVGAMYLSLTRTHKLNPMAKQMGLNLDFN